MFTGSAVSALYGDLPRIGGIAGQSFVSEPAFTIKIFMTFGTLQRPWLLEASVDYAMIEKLLGHRLQGMGEGYIHNWEHRLREAFKKMRRAWAVVNSWAVTKILKFLSGWFYGAEGQRGSPSPNKNAACSITCGLLHRLQANRTF